MKYLLTKAQEKAELTIFNDLNITTKVRLDQSLNGNYLQAKPIQEHPISTSTIGVIALMMDTLFVDVEVLFHEEAKLLSVEYHFSYSHPSGGRNGCHAKKTFEISSL